MALCMKSRTQKTFAWFYQLGHYFAKLNRGFAGLTKPEVRGVWTLGLLSAVIHTGDHFFAILFCLQAVGFILRLTPLVPGG